MRCATFTCCLTIALTAAPVAGQPELVSNGDFESWNDPPTLPVGWSNSGGAIVRQKPGMEASGLCVELSNPGGPLTAALSQSLSTEITGQLVFSVDFAFESVAAGGDRSFNLTLRDASTIRINIRVSADNALQFFDRNSGLQGGGGTQDWQTVVEGLQASDFALGTIHWYRMTIAADLSTDTMRVTLKDLTTGAILAQQMDASDKWDVPASGGPGAGINTIVLAIGRSQADYRADNISLRAAVPLRVNAGPDQAVLLTDGAATLQGGVTDDGLPDPPGIVHTVWSVDSQPAGGNAQFADPSALSTTVTFEAAGTYILRLTGCDDGVPGACNAPEAHDTMTLTVVPDLPVFTIDLQPSPGPELSVNNSAAWWSPITISPTGTVYLAWLAANSPADDVIVSQRWPAGKWSWIDTGVDARYDIGHTQASLALDGDGHLHVFYDMHNNPMRSIRTLQAGHLAAGFISQSGQFPPAGRYTYPNLATADNGDLYMIIRDRQSAHLDRTGWFFRYDLQQQTWLDLGAFSGQAGTTIYPDQVFSPGDGTLRIIWEWAAGGAQGSRHLGSYASYDPATGRFSRADGTVYDPSQIPISIASADLYQPLEGNEQFVSGMHGVQSAKMAVDSRGYPVIAYSYSLDGTASGYEHRLAIWNGQTWERRALSEPGMSIEKPWVSVHPRPGGGGDVIRYYTQYRPGRGDLYVRISEDGGQTFSPPVLVAGGLNISRPMGVSRDGVDYLYLPSQGQRRMYLARVTAGTIVAADLDWDHDVDQADFGLFQLCFSGAAMPHEEGCGAADLQQDGDVDAEDLTMLLGCLAGAGVEPDPGCIPPAQ